jgi:hypothetical protein
MDLGYIVLFLKTRLYPLGRASVEIVFSLLFLIKAYPRQLHYAVFTDMALLGQYHCLQLWNLVVLRFNMFIFKIIVIYIVI